MTLVASLITNRFIQQAADRLVTKAGRTYDEAANKALLYLASDAVVAIGYSGPAYVTGVPTDEFIAGALLGQTDLPKDAIRMTLGGSKGSPDVGLAVRRLVERTATAFKSDSRLRAQSFELSAVGWRWRTRRPFRPPKTVVWKVNHSGDGVVYLRHLPSPVGGQLLLSATPAGWADERDEKAMLDEVVAAGPVPDATEHALTTFLRRTADRHPKFIGRDCQVISLPRPKTTESGLGHIRVTARPDPSRPPDCATPVGYSPWLVGAKTLVRPSLITGGFTFRLGPFNVVVEGSPNPRGASIHAQERSPG